MYREALQRLEDAEVLYRASSVGAPMDSVHFLQLLGLELLLKLAYEVALQRKAPSNHKYHEIFQDLPATMKNTLLELAEKRIGPSSLTNDALLVLKEWGKNFIDLRYPYEQYESFSEDEYSELGKKWLENGASIEEATFKYYPDELFGILHALRIVTDAMANKTF